jgi:predicted N-acetyltransferase YhbS
MDDADLNLEIDGARCALWWRTAPPWPDARLGVIGRYAAADDRSAVALLHAACAALRDAACGLAVAPMDGNTWRSYRAVTERGSEPPFFLEPDTPEAWPAQFAAAGFSVLATYHSSLATAPFERDPRMPAAAARLRRAGVVVRDVDMTRFEAELGAIHALSLAAFARNFLYTPISREAFVAQYLPVAPRVDPRLVLVAECDGRTVGFLFAIADWAEAQRTGQPPTTVIVKTVAVAPERRFAGLGAHLVDLVQARAEALGFRRAVHALMHDANNSANISARSGKVMRRYALFARRLA